MLVRWRSVREVETPMAPGVETLLEQAGHFTELLLVGMFSRVRAALAHDEGAQGGVRKVRADVDGARLALQGVEVLGERLPVPAQPLVQRGAGDVLDAFHHGDQPVVAVRGHGSEPDPAVAHGHRRHPVMRRRGQQRVPRRLAVVVGVGIDEPRGDQQAVGIELAAARWRCRHRRRRSALPRWRRRLGAPARPSRRPPCRFG